MNKTKLFFLLLAVLMLLCSVAAADGYTAGTYTASAYGMIGDVTVTVTFSDTAMTAIDVAGNETVGIGTLAMEQLPKAMIDAQSADVDTVASATVTSNAIIAAVKDCIAQAKGETAADEAQLSTSADVIVIGAGSAGLAAAAGAGEAGASVIVLEANGRAGGSASLSGGHMTMIDDALNKTMERNDKDLEKYAAYNEADFGEWAEALTALKAQIAAYTADTGAYRFDSIERTLVDHFKSASGKDLDGNAATLDYALVKEAVTANMDITEWLKSGGMEVETKYYKDHANTPIGKGAGMIEAQMVLAERAGAQIHYNTRGIRLVTNEAGAVTGVIAILPDGTEATYTANKGVVIATGSFSSNGEMAANYQRVGTGLNAENGSTNPATNVGDGIVMAQEIGAQLRDMQFISTMIFGYNNGCSYVDWGKFGGKQQLTVNADAVRYADETKNSKLVNQPGGLMYHVGDAKMVEALGAVSDTFVDTMKQAGVLLVADTLEEAASMAGLDAAKLADTVAAFNSYVDAGADADFGRTEFNGKVENGPYAIAIGEAFYHLTFGGLVTDTNAQVLDTEGKLIPGLYASGDVTTGIEGANHQSGACLTAAIYYGRKAGQMLAK